MAKDYAAISKKIVENIGGVENIASVTHCMTRLRFVVKDEGKINDAAVKATDGVMGVVNQGGQYQIIIGNHVEEAYNEVLKMGDFGEASQVARGEKKEPLTLKKVGNNILDAIVGTMSPLIPAIIGGSMVKLLVMLLGMVGVLSADSETYKILNTIGDAAFYFLPVMVAASASKKFNTNMFIAIAIAGLMLHPDFRTMMEAVTVGDTAAHFLGIPVVGVKYTYTVIPALCMTWILSYIERAIDKITPAVTKNFLKPMLIFLIAAPIAIIVVGPAGIMIGEGISAFVYFVQAKLGFLAVGIMGALWPLLVITGMHRVFTPTILQPVPGRRVPGRCLQDQEQRAAPDRSGRCFLCSDRRHHRARPVRRGRAPEAPPDRFPDHRLRLRLPGRHGRSGQPFHGVAQRAHRRAVHRPGQPRCEHRLDRRHLGAVHRAVLCADAGDRL